MKLFASLSAAEAEEAERGALRGDFLWVDGPGATDGGEDAIWVTIDIPDNRMGKFEKRSDRGLGYRQFLLPARVTNLHPVQRVPR